MDNEGAEREQRTNQTKNYRCRTAKGINAYHVISRTDNDVTYLDGVLKMNFAKPKFRELLHIREIRENFVPRKFPAIRYLFVYVYIRCTCMCMYAAYV